MSNKALSKNIEQSLRQQNVGEFSPGEVGRRYEPAGGLKNHERRIHEESAYADKHKKLPFTFSKPKKFKKSKIKACSNCDTYVNVNKDTVGIICVKCKQYVSVKEVCLGE